VCGCTSLSYPLHLGTVTWEGERLHSEARKMSRGWGWVSKHFNIKIKMWKPLKFTRGGKMCYSWQPSVLVNTNTSLQLPQIWTEDKTMSTFLLCVCMNAFVELLPRDKATDSISTFPILVSWLDVELTVCVSLETLRSVNCQRQIKR